MQIKTDTDRQRKLQSLYTDILSLKGAPQHPDVWQIPP